MSRYSQLIKSAEEMKDLGAKVGSKLTAGNVVVLRGELGSGKTTFTQGVGRALGIGELTSPTFVISKIYPGVIPLVHVDAYRLIGHEFAAFDDLDLETLIPHSITIIEWGSGFAERLTDSFIEIDIAFESNSDERIVNIVGLDI